MNNVFIQTTNCGKKELGFIVLIAPKDSQLKFPTTTPKLYHHFFIEKPDDGKPEICMNS